MAHREATRSQGSTREKVASSRSQPAHSDEHRRRRVDSVLSGQTPHKGQDNVPRSSRIDPEDEEDDEDDDYYDRGLLQAKPVDIPPPKSKDASYAGTTNLHGSWRREEVSLHPQQAPGRNFPTSSDSTRHYDLAPSPPSWSKSSEWISHPSSNTLAPPSGWPTARANSNVYAPPQYLPRQVSEIGRTSGDLILQSGSRSEPSNLTQLGQRFAQIRVGQVRECVTFIISDQAVLKEDAQLYLREAGALYRKSKIQDARACVQQALIIDHCSDLDNDDIKEFLKDLAASRKLTVNKLLKDVDKTFAVVKAKSDALTSAENNPTQHATAGERNRHTATERQPQSDSFQTQPSPSQITSDLVNRFASFDVTTSQISSVLRPMPPEPARGDRHQATNESRASQPSIGNQGSRNSLQPEQIGIRGTKGEFEPLDPRYRQRRDKAEFFIVGRLFAILWHENMGINKSKKGPGVEPTHDHRFGEKIFSHIRRMIVVRSRYGYCWCVAINTYGGRGLIGKNRSDAEIQSHTIVHESTSRPVMFKEEHGLMTKEPIAIDVVAGHTLEMASRLNYAKVSTVEHNVKVMEIGMVSSASMPYFLAHWRAEMGS